MWISRIAATVIVACGFSAAALAQDLTVVSWGGAFTKSQVEAYHKPWVLFNPGAKVNSVDYNGGLAEIKAQVAAGNVTWDVVDVEKSQVVQGCDEGILEILDISDLPTGSDGTKAQNDFIAGGLHECGVANIVWSTIYAYDRSKFSGRAVPTTISDLFDVKKFPGKRGLRKDPKTLLEMALMADGVPADEVYATLATKAGVDRAFRKLDAVKDHVVWWEAGAQPPQLLADGEVALTTAYNGRIFNAIAGENKPFEIVWDGQILDFDFFVIPAGSPNRDQAWEFIKFSTGTGPLAAQASYISYGPARKSSAQFVGKYHTGDIEMGPHMPTAPENTTNALVNDFDFWADYQDELDERFNAWLASS
jgi:putative spermidine/putrescine transport system substrate-binding protein